MDELLELRAKDEQRDVGARVGRALETWLPGLSASWPQGSSGGGSSTSTGGGGRQL